MHTNRTPSPPAPSPHYPASYRSPSCLQHISRSQGARVSEKSLKHSAGRSARATPSWVAAPRSLVLIKSRKKLSKDRWAWISSLWILHSHWAWITFQLLPHSVQRCRPWPPCQPQQKRRALRLVPRPWKAAQCTPRRQESG